MDTPYMSTQDEDIAKEIELERLEETLPEDDEDLAEDELESGLWPGDTGTLEQIVRQVLVKLLRGPYLSNIGSDTKLWIALRQNEEIVRSRLHDLFLELVIDEASGYAFAKNVEAEDNKFPRLMRTQRLNNAQTMLIVRARQLQLKASTQNLVAYMDFSEIKEYLRPWMKLENVIDEAKLNDRVSATIKSLCSNNILVEVEGGERYQVNEIVAGLLSASTAENYKRAYEEFMQEHGVAAAQDEETTEVDTDAAESEDQ